MITRPDDDDDSNRPRVSPRRVNRHPANRRARRVSAPREMGLYRLGLPQHRWDTEGAEYSAQGTVYPDGRSLSSISREGSLVE